MIKVLNKLLDVYYEDRNIFQIIFWWEIRRILYNVIVLVAILISLSIIGLLANVPSGEDVIEPLAAMGFLFLCNLGYTLGWVTEIFIERDATYAPNFFKVGLAITLIVVALPAVYHIFAWIFRGVGITI